MIPVAFDTLNHFFHPELFSLLALCDDPSCFYFYDLIWSAEFISTFIGLIEENKITGNLRRILLSSYFILSFWTISSCCGLFNCSWYAFYFEILMYVLSYPSFEVQIHVFTCYSIFLLFPDTSKFYLTEVNICSWASINTIFGIYGLGNKTSTFHANQKTKDDCEHLSVFICPSPIFNQWKDYDLLPKHLLNLTAWLHLILTP